MNGGKEVIMDAKLWMMFKQRGYDIEWFLLNDAACIGNRTISWLRIGKRIEDYNE